MNNCSEQRPQLLIEQWLGSMTRIDTTIELAKSMWSIPGSTTLRCHAYRASNVQFMAVPLSWFSALLFKLQVSLPIVYSFRRLGWNRFSIWTWTSHAVQLMHSAVYYTTRQNDNHSSNRPIACIPSTTLLYLCRSSFTLDRWRSSAATFMNRLDDSERCMWVQLTSDWMVMCLCDLSWESECGQEEGAVLVAKANSAWRLLTDWNPRIIWPGPETMQYEQHIEHTI